MGSTKKAWVAVSKGLILVAVLVAGIAIFGKFSSAATQPWSGILSSTRGTDWSTAGVTGGVPSGSWTQCGATIAAYSGNTDKINAAINHTGSGYTGCGANTYVQLGAGTFNLSSGGSISNGLVFKGLSNTALRGMGANQTFLVFASGAADSCGGGYSSAICMNGGAGSYWVTDGAATWTAGFTQGTNVITIKVTGAYSASQSYSAGQVVSYNGVLYLCQASCTGNTPTTGYYPWSNITPNDTIIGLDQCSTGNSGSPCSTNPEPDNGNYWDCDILYSSPSGGCAVNGPDGGNQRLNRPQNELFQVSAVNVATGQLTLIGSLRDPNWNPAETPQVFVASNPDQYDGVENLSVDTSASGSNGIVLLYTANSWVQGVRLVKPAYAGVWGIVADHNTIDENYIYSTTHAPGSDSFGINFAPSSDNLVQDNIIQAVQVPLSNEGADSGSVYSYNFTINDYDGDGGIYPSVFPHAGDRYQLYEGNVINSYYGENYHGPKIMNTLFRNLITGWESCANGNCGSSTAKGGGGNGTTAVRMVEGSRYQNIIGNVLGTPGYHNSYSTTAGFADSNIYEIGSGNGPIPVDPIVAQTLLRWGNYDVVTGATRWCGSASDSGWSTVCGGISEVSANAPAYPNGVPTVGDTAAGQAALPASFYLSSKPSWWGNLPWPAIGPDVTGGDVGQCSGALNVAGKYNGVAAMSAAQCAGSSLNTAAWAGHVSAIPAMNCYLNTMNGAPDGTGNLLSFNASTCYGSGGGGGGDTTPPTISITAPANGATVSGTASLSANASDNVGVTSVTFYLDGNPLGQDTSAPYTYNWNTVATTNGTHTLTAKASDAAGNIGTSNSVSVTVNNSAGGDTTPPSVPTNLSASAVSTSQINLTWTASTDNVGVTGYKVYRGGTQIATTTTNSYSNTGLSASTNYSYTVSAYDAAGNNSGQSSAASATTQASADTTPPSTPTNLTASAVSSSQINLSWTASTDNVGVTGYKVFRSGTQIATTNTNSYSNTGLTASTNYSYTVSAYDAAGNNSGQSSSASATTQSGGTGGGGGTPIAFVQGANSIGGSASSISQAFTNNVTSGDAIAVLAGARNADVASVVSTCTPTFTKVDTAINGAIVATSTDWYAVANTSGSCTVTANFSGTSQGASIIISELSGVNATNPVDAHAAMNQDGTTNSTDAITSGAATTAAAGDYIWGATVSLNGGYSTISAGTGFTLNVPLLFGAIEGETQSSAGSIAATFTDSADLMTYSHIETFMIAFRGASVTPPPDTTPPSTPTNLTASAVSSSQINLSWTASTDNVGVTGYKVFRSGTQIATTNTNSYSNTGLTASTNYSYTVSAYDAAGNNSGQSSSASATTQAGADTIPPTTSITSPANGATVSGTITVSATASDNVGVTRVELYLDGTLVGTDTASPYTFSENSANVANGTHTLYTKAYDAAGNVGTSPNVAVTVSNVVQTPFKILNVLQASTTPNSLVLIILTNEPASVRVQYGTTLSYGKTTAASPELTTIYENMTRLNASTTYDFRVLSIPQGSTSTITSQNFIFQTAPNTGGHGHK